MCCIDIYMYLAGIQVPSSFKLFLTLLSSVISLLKHKYLLKLKITALKILMNFHRNMSLIAFAYCLSGVFVCF